MDKSQMAEKLSDQHYGYFHLDILVKCPHCKYTPAFGRELEDSHPIYWYPQHLPMAYKRLLTAAFAKYRPPQPCPWCHRATELHKVWINAWQKDEPVPSGDVIRPDVAGSAQAHFEFIVPTASRKVHGYYLPVGILGQMKCTNGLCKYVYYTTI